MKYRKRCNPLPRWLRAIACILASILLLLALYVALGCPATFRMQFRRAEKANMVGPSKILYTLSANHEYEKMIIGETDHGICFFGVTGSEVTGFSHSGKRNYTFTYRQKDGDLTLASIPPFWGFDYQNSQSVYLFDMHPEAVSASVLIKVVGVDSSVNAGSATTQNINETFEATAERLKDGHFVFYLESNNSLSATALYYLAEATSGKLFPRYSATITVTVQLYDAQGNQILIRDMDLSY